MKQGCSRDSVVSRDILVVTPDREAGCGTQ